MMMESLRQLEGEPTLVIYCGAGVTVDRTGLGWNNLVLKVFKESNSASGLTKEECSAIQALIEDKTVDARKKASVVCQSAGVQDETAYLSPILEKVLYAENGWQEGYILRNLARLVLGLAFLGKRVRIVTSNYDDYIEKAISIQRGLWLSHAGEDTKVPGFIVKHLIDKGDKDFVDGVISEYEPVNGAQTIQLIYIHGRKAQGADPNGQLVFSESSYSSNRAKEISTLNRQFHEDAAVLIVGASLEDEPLIETLIQIKTQTVKRYGFLVPNGKTLEERTANRFVNRLRGEHLGVRILSPDYFAQVAQYIDELRVFIELCGAGAQEDYFTSFSYGIRLRQWWEKWSTSEWHRDHNAHFEILKDTVSSLRAYFEDVGICREEIKEVLKLEAWVRIDPSYSRDIRSLTLWANSVGPLRTREAFREEQISPDTSVAAVIAFQHGRPMLLSLSDLGFEAKASRWKSFFAVPVFVESVHNLPKESGQDASVRVAGTVPVAVMCLASSLPVEAESGACSSFADPMMLNEHYEKVKDLLIGSGRIISGTKVHSETRRSSLRERHRPRSAFSKTHRVLSRSKRTR